MFKGVIIILGKKIYVEYINTVTVNTVTMKMLRYWNILLRFWHMLSTKYSFECKDISF